MRRLMEEGMTSRFITGARVELVLKVYIRDKSRPNTSHFCLSGNALQAFGAIEYMVGALTCTVLCELLLRGRPSRTILDRGRTAH